MTLRQGLTLKGKSLVISLLPLCQTTLISVRIQSLHNYILLMKKCCHFLPATLEVEVRPLQTVSSIDGAASYSSTYPPGMISARSDMVTYWYLTWA